MDFKDAPKLKLGQPVRLKGIEDHHYIVKSFEGEGDAMKVWLDRDDLQPGMETYFDKNEAENVSIANDIKIEPPKSKDKGKDKEQPDPEDAQEPKDEEEPKPEE